MQVQYANLDTYRDAMRRLPIDRMLTKADLLTTDFLMEQHGKVEMYYAPHNEVINRNARIVMIGITPGWTQMKLAYEAAVSCMAQGMSDEDMCRIAQREARFAGSMRSNMISMLNELNLHEELNRQCHQQGAIPLNSCEGLFTTHSQWLHTTSLLRYPVFVNGANYTGSQPDLISAAYLLEAAKRDHEEELSLWNQALVIPLGKTVEKFLRLLEQEGRFNGSSCLWGFPHSSGANGHRYKQFAEHREEMKRVVHGFMNADPLYRL